MATNGSSTENIKHNSSPTKPSRYIPPHFRTQLSNNNTNNHTVKNKTDTKFIPSTSYWGNYHSKQKASQALPSGFVKLSSVVRKNHDYQQKSNSNPAESLPVNNNNNTSIKSTVENSNLKKMSSEIFRSNDSFETIGGNEEGEIQSYQWADASCAGDSSETDWRDNNASLEQQFLYMLHHDIRTDCSVTVGTHNKQVFRCHKVHLSRASSKLDSLIYAADAEQQEILIPNIEPATFKDLLQYMYTGHIQLTCYDQALALCHAAIHCLMPVLRDLCANYICATLTPEHFWSALEIVLNINEPRSFRQQCLQYLQVNTQACLNSSQFVLASLSSLIWLLQQEDLNIESEMDLILAATCWAIRETETGWLFQDDPSSPSLLRCALGPAFSHLRFLSLSPSEFSLGLADSDLLSEHEKFTILVNIITPGHIPLPDGICTNINKRNSKDGPVDISKIDINFMTCFRPRIKTPFINGINTKKMYSNLEFICDKDIKMLGVEVTTQYKNKDDLPNNIAEERCVAYEEDIVVTLYEKDAMNNIASSKYDRTAPYNTQLAILFPQRVLLKKDKTYRINVKYRKTGNYLTFVRCNHVCVNDINFKFGFEEEIGLIESIIFGN